MTHSKLCLLRGRLQRTSGKWGGGGFKISDIPGREEGVVCESSDVWKFLKKSKFQNFSEFFKVKTRNYSRSRFQYKSIHIWERSHMTSARFWQILPPPPPCQQLSALSDPPWWRQHLPDPPPFQSDISFSKNRLHSTLIETLNVYLIQLKTELCRQFRGVY